MITFDEELLLLEFGKAWWKQEAYKVEAAAGDDVLLKKCLDSE